MQKCDPFQLGGQLYLPYLQRIPSTEKADCYSIVTVPQLDIKWQFRNNIP